MTLSIRNRLGNYLNINISLTIFSTVVYVITKTFTISTQVQTNGLLINGRFFRSDTTYSHQTIKSISLFNETNFKFLINLPDICNNYENLSSVVLVHSDPRNTSRREAIRQTWGTSKDVMPVLFLMGTTFNGTIDRKIQEESFVYKDIIQGNFLDSYRNLTYKHVMSLLWSTLYCPSVEFILKTDDDIFVNIPSYNKYIDYLKESYTVNENLLLLHCYKLQKNVTVFRDRANKWRMSFQEYPFFYYPDYCGGWGEVFSRPAVLRILEQVNHAEFLWIDDVYVGGILPSLANIEIKLMNSPLMPYEFYDAYQYEDVLPSSPIGPGDLEPYQMYILWNLLNSHTDDDNQ